MHDIFWAVVLGHLTADYLLQPKEMAVSKSRKGWKGLGWCTLHCLVYATCVCGFCKSWSFGIFATVYISHFLPDRYSLAAWWIKKIKGRDLLSEHLDNTSDFREIRIAFACLIYAVVDNTMHLVVLWWTLGAWLW